MRSSTSITRRDERCDPCSPKHKMIRKKQELRFHALVTRYPGVVGVAYQEVALQAWREYSCGEVNGAKDDDGVVKQPVE